MYCVIIGFETFRLSFEVIKCQEFNPAIQYFCTASYKSLKKKKRKNAMILTKDNGNKKLVQAVQKDFKSFVGLLENFY